ncbi:hypothetical protein F5Y17DRAFT_280472 [Xylariaceae sp. FL0594]|nr:hypothetical protein F5Y17DRAFT_280472 [Xylariaceae sp. FL0594]
MLSFPRFIFLSFFFLFLFSFFTSILVFQNISVSFYSYSFLLLLLAPIFSLSVVLGGGAFLSPPLIIRYCTYHAASIYQPIRYRTGFFSEFSFRDVLSHVRMKARCCCSCCSCCSNTTLSGSV